MKLPATLEKHAAKFDQMSIRERVLIAAATVVAVVMIWMIAISDPLSAKQRSLQAEMTSIQDSMSSTIETFEAAAASDPVAKALIREKQLKQRLDEINSQLNSQSAGLIPPERMVQVIHDVLSKQHGVKLISLHNKPVASLVAPANASQVSSPTQASDEASTAIDSGPYMHPVELVIEGRYLDVMNYLRELESLSWHFYWKQLSLESTEYPLNRVRIELGTLSLEKEWIGV
jgi:MSHA biogenesis protein MshJ